VLWALVDPSGAGHVDRQAFSRGIVLALSKRVRTWREPAAVAALGSAPETATGSATGLAAGSAAGSVSGLASGAVSVHAHRPASDGLLIAAAVAVLACSAQRGLLFVDAPVDDPSLHPTSGDPSASDPSSSDPTSGVPSDPRPACALLALLSLLLLADWLRDAANTGLRGALRTEPLAVASSAGTLAAFARAAAVAVSAPPPSFSSATPAHASAALHDAFGGSRALLVGLLLCRCADMARLLSRVPTSRRTFETIGRVLPAIRGQTSVIFALLHACCWVGMVCWGGLIGMPPTNGSNPDAYRGSGGRRVFYPASWADSEPYYGLLNFNSYGEGLVTLFALVVVNNWNVISGGYAELPPPYGGPKVYAFFIAFNALAVRV